MARSLFLIILIVSVLSSGAVSAHTLGIDKAELVELGDGNYRLSSFVPPVLANYISTPELPKHCTFTGSPRGERGIYEVRYLFSCEGPLTAQHQIYLPWQREGVMLTVNWEGQEPITKFSKRVGTVITLDLGQYLAGSGSLYNAAKRYTLLGIEHILLGVDHLLFVLGLLFLVQGKMQLIKTITAFTVAHSITLALATLGFVHVPDRPVDAIVALSIVFLAAEICYVRLGRKGLTYRHPWVVSFGFGLIHGLGFAGALTSIGIPQAEVPPALLFFNVGVEIGQLLFVMLFVCLTWSFRQLEMKFSPRLDLVPAYLIGTAACYWLFERMEVIIFS